MLFRFYQYLLKNQVIFALVIIVFGWLLFQIRGIVTLVFLSYIFMAALLPAVKFLRRYHFPTILAVLLPFVAVIIVLVSLIFLIVPFFVSQIQALFINLPIFIKQTFTSFGIQLDVRQIQDYVTPEIGSIGRNAFQVTTWIFGGLFSTLTVLIISFYLLMYHDKFNRAFARFFHKDMRESVVETMSQIDDKLGAWLRGQVILCAAIGLMSWVALTLIALPYALPLSVIAALLEALPTIGPILAAVPAFVVAMTVSPNLAITVAIIYLVIQLLENHILVPNIMRHAVGLNPIIVIIGIMIGGNLLGIAGALLSIPFISFLTVLFSNLNDID